MIGVDAAADREDDDDDIHSVYRSTICAGSCAGVKGERVKVLSLGRRPFSRLARDRVHSAPSTSLIMFGR